MKTDLSIDYLMYLAVGAQKYKSELILSVLSYFRIEPKPVEIIILSDDITEIQRVFSERDNIIYEQLSEETVDDWLNGMLYYPRLKIKAMEFAMSKYQGNIIFVDSDTFFTQSPNDLFSGINCGTSLMHSRCMDMIDELALFEYEGIIPVQYRSGYQLFCDIRANGSLLYENEKYDMNITDPLYNSGVLGIPRAFAGCFDEVLKLSDLICRKSGYWCAEEMAFSIVFNRLGDIEVCDESVYHYYNSKIGRFILSEHLNYLHESDIVEYAERLKEAHLKKFCELDADFERVPYLMHFVSQYLPNTVALIVDKDSFSDAYTDIRSNQIPVRLFKEYIHQSAFQNTVIRNYSYYRMLLKTYKRLTAQNMTKGLRMRFLADEN